MSSTVGEIRTLLEKAYPPALAESWDKVGLICGDPAEPVDTVAFALDCTQEVAERAVALGAQMLVVHHPLLLRGVHSVAADTPKGRVLHTLIRGGVALFAAHTNADSARPGVNDKLAELVGITPGAPIVAQPAPAKDHWGVHIPAEAVESVKSALFSAGAGEIGDYRECSFDIDGTGQFRPVEGANPAEGSVGELHRGPEVRVEFVAARRRRAAILSALRYTHPYEEPAFDIVALEDDTPADQATGLGRIGELPEPMTLREFTQHVADVLPETAWGVRCAGDPEQIVQRVAVSSGAGDSFLDAVRGLGVDVYVTSDLRHHPVDEYLRAGGPAVIDTAHWASEFPWTSQAAEVVAAGAEVRTEIIDIRTDPWTLGARRSGAQDRSSEGQEKNSWDS
ncbi:Nif3-like dinuclear metal center hexameric protein [Corynebacterium uropygiale]|uniref:GTP cyclohydrolase 1 type 2 homolog n=1 Tax=Corynebacterium uropygiale TaxID=1775911 RepID=A0A9X1QQY5_9CORY|nr:Nif3-like dinuclear metal center hexameric protein [Corynebacterium uropygiale]